MDGLHRCDHLDTFHVLTYFFKEARSWKICCLPSCASRAQEVRVNSLNAYPSELFPSRIPRAASRRRAGSHGGAQLNLSQARGPPKLRARL